MQLKHRLYAQFLVAILPLALLLGYLAFARNDLPQRVDAALRAYDLALDAGGAFKDFLSGAADALDSGRLSSDAFAALKRAHEREERLGELSVEDQPIAGRLAGLEAALATNASVAALLPLKGEVQGVREALTQSAQRKRDAITALVEEQRSSAQRREQILLTAAFGTVLLFVFIAYVLRRLVLGITRPLAEAVTVAGAIAKGRLDNRITPRGNDEMGQLLRAMEAMQDELSHIVRSVRAGADSVANESDTLSHETLALSNRSEEQASSLEEAAASMEELSGAVRENSASAHAADELAREAAQTAVVGGAAVRQVVTTMRTITASSSRITDIVGVIDSIAFQTNILALNAAVEAARAGEQGRGFAVVASEVRSLAQRSATAATEIKQLVGASVADIEGGGREADEAGHSIEVLVQTVQKVSALMSQIAAASIEQERGIRQVSASVTQMEGAVQQNAAAVQHSAAASDKLKRDAQDLAQTVSRFEVTADSAAPAVNPVEPRLTGTIPRLSQRVRSSRAPPR